ncbi:MAG: hypothetical protein ABSB87_13700 [Terriglobales bacterium]|jgi:hypothetical protein
MNWQLDNSTKTAARKYPLPIYSATTIAQDPGSSVDAADFVTRLRPGDVFNSSASASLQCSPVQIVDEFKLLHYLQAVALTICWGSMTRTKNKYIYRGHALQHIFGTLDQCAQSIQKTSSIQQSWDLLVNGLSWTPVMTSKTLHFLCRALGFEQDPPVPIDNAVILAYVWPGFRINVPPSQRPLDWSGKSFAAYCRYMTAILEWSDIKSWSTTELESTIFAENR